MSSNRIKPVTILDFFGQSTGIEASVLKYLPNSHFESRFVIDLSTFDAIAKMVEA